MNLLSRSRIRKRNDSGVLGARGVHKLGLRTESGRFAGGSNKCTPRLRVGRRSRLMLASTLRERAAVDWVEADLVDQLRYRSLRLLVVARDRDAQALGVAGGTAVVAQSRPDDRVERLHHAGVRQVRLQQFARRCAVVVQLREVTVSLGVVVRRGHELATIVSDPDNRRVVEVLEGRSRRVVERYLRSLTAAQRQAIAAVSIDPYDAYRQAVRRELPQAQIVCDPFHLVRGANEALETVRRERQRQPALRRRQQGRKPRTRSWRQQLFHARHRLLKARERLSFQQRRSLCELFEAEPLIAEAWALKEAFRAIYRSTSRSEAEQRLERFLAAVDRAAIPSFSAFAEGIRLWREELLAYFDQPITNGYAEGVINKIKVIKRRAYGLPTFNGFRQRVLVACG